MSAWCLPPNHGQNDYHTRRGVWVKPYASSFCNNKGPMRIPLNVVDSIKATLTKGNEKLGLGVYVWSIPAELTCPGASNLCRDLCYAMKYRFTTGRYFRQATENWLMAATPFFAKWMADKIKASKCGVVRIHTSGDFFSETYVRQWIGVVKALPSVSFYAYTRSWRVPAMRSSLGRLSRLKNMQLWYSEDSETGVPKLRAGERRVRLAYLATSLEDIPEQADLIFRDYPTRGVVQKNVSGILVCPAENGTGKHIQCSQCGICFSDPEKYPNKRAGGRFERTAPHEQPPQQQVLRAVPA